ncbi:hypothetical protein PUN4_230137 [Paraburkholderia unamae]|nr:hypothetical protein PUN4_230137 [Paraburkholderia unamae]
MSVEVDVIMYPLGLFTLVVYKLNELISSFPFQNICHVGASNRRQFPKILRIGWLEPIM